MGLDGQLDAVEQRIEALREELEACRRAIRASRAAVWLAVGALALVFTVAGSYRTAPVVLGAITAIVGGTVWSGASRSSRDEALAALAAAEALKGRLIDEVAARNGWDNVPPTLH